MTALTLSAADPPSLRADALVVGIAKGPRGPVLAPGAEAVDRALGGRLAETLASLGATGAAGETTRLATLGAVPAPVVLAAGLGDAARRGSGYGTEALRRGAGAALRALTGCRRVATTLALANGAADTEAVAAVGEGALMGAYRFARYRGSGGTTPPEVETVTVAVGSTRDRAVKAAVRRAEVVAGAVALCRDLVNTPPGNLHPAEFAASAVEAAKAAGVEVEVLDDKALRKGGYGGILGIGQGSAHPPRLVRIAHRPARAKASVAIVGKGVTFDSGGLSLKPSTAMEPMKSDMGGAAAVLAAITAAARLDVPVEVVGWIPMVENMPGGGAIRPSDVLTMYGGRTVEITNTDAEGRVIMADAIVRAAEDGPDYLVDIATLTGAQFVSLGSLTSGVMGTDDLRDRVVAAGDRAGELMWPMPMPRELRRSLDSDIADMENTGDRIGGMIVAAFFLREFVPDALPWAHIDIAAPAFNQGEAWGYTPRGGTGVGVRTLLSFLEDVAAAG